MANSDDGSMLLALPRELRDEIYQHYLQVDGGYVYDLELGKLVCATPAGARRPIDLALMLSCQQIADEMQGLALKTNTVTFSSVDPDGKQQNLLYYNARIHDWWQGVFKCLQEKDFDHPLRRSPSDWWPVPNFDESVYRKVAESFPNFAPHLRFVQSLASEPHHYEQQFEYPGGEEIDFDEQVYTDWTCEWPFYWGVAGSLQRQAGLETLKMISSRGCWSEKAWSDVNEVDKGPAQRRGGYRVPTTDRAGDLLRFHSLYKPWTIPEDDATEDIRFIHRHPAHFRPDYKTLEEYERKPLEYCKGRLMSRFFLSAASLAIHFLESIPAQRRNMRNIILDEKHRCIAYSECHGLGLIKFCQENPDLRVERRANLWRSIWPCGTEPPFSGIDEGSLTYCVADWIVEALALVPAGMPLGSFTLVLDGNPEPEECTKLFQRVQRDAAWQTAFCESFDRAILSDVALEEKTKRECYFFNDFPQAMRDISRGTCRAVRANFDVGEPWDVEAMIEAHRGWKITDWENNIELGIRYPNVSPFPEDYPPGYIWRAEED